MLAEGADEQLLDFPDDLVEVQWPRLHDVAAGEGQQLTGELGRAPGGQLDLPDVIADRPQVDLRAILGHLFADERRVVRDDGEQVVEVMGDAPGELAQALQPLRLLQLEFQLDVEQRVRGGGSRLGGQGSSGGARRDVIPHCHLLQQWSTRPLSQWITSTSRIVT